MPSPRRAAPSAAVSKHLTTCGWDDVPHITPDVRAELEAALVDLNPHEREARTQGTPSLGSGAVFPMPWDDLQIAPHPIPASWPRLYALDVGWRRTAALWGALDREQDTIVLYSEHYLAESDPPIHAAAIQARGAWIPGLIDPASRGRSQADGRRMIDLYAAHGLKLKPANNAVESGIMKVLEYASQGRLKFFSTLTNTRDEWRLYQRDEKGKIKKMKDHLMDCLRYLVAGIHSDARTKVEHVIRRAPNRGDPAVGF